MDAPPVAIVIPTYNRASLVGRAIDSVLAQSYPNIQVIVVDDGSRDGTVELLRHYDTDKRVRVVRHPSNRGVTAAKNTGLGAIDHDCRYVGILDSDDVLLPRAIETLEAVFVASPDRYSQVLGWHEDRETGFLRGRMTARSGEVTYLDALNGRFAGDFWHLARRDLLGDMRFEERASGGEGALWWRLLKARPAWLVSDVVGVVDASGADRVSGWDGTADGARSRMWAYQATIDAVGEDLRRESPRRFGLMMAELSKWAAVAGEVPRARSASRAALRYAPSPRTLALTVLARAPGAVVRTVAVSRTTLRERLGAHR